MLKELDYTFERKDYVKFLYFDMSKKKSTFLFALITLVITIHCFTKNTNTDIIEFVIFILSITAFIWYLLSPYIATLKFDKTTINVQFNSEEKTFFSSAIFLIQTVISSTIVQVNYNWNNVNKIYNAKHGIMIYMEENEAIVLPKRIFKGEQELNEAWNLIQECYNKNKKEQ